MTVAVTVRLPAGVVPLRRVGAVGNTPLDEMIGTIATTIAGIATTTVVTGTVIAETATVSALVTVPAAPMTGTVMPRTIGKGAMMTASAVMTSARMARMAKTGKV